MNNMSNPQHSQRTPIPHFVGNTALNPIPTPPSDCNKTHRPDPPDCNETKTPSTTHTVGQRRREADVDALPDNLL